MTPDECLQVHNELIEMLRQVEMTWIIEQVNETILLGKSHSKKVKTFKERSGNDQLQLIYDTNQSPATISEYRARPTGPEVDLTATLEYTPQERLKLLITAIEQAVVETAEMEQITVRNLEALSKDQHIFGIAFISEQNDREELLLSNQSSEQRITTAHQLRQFLYQLRSAIYDH